jgi:hypothetical protein
MSSMAPAMADLDEADAQQPEIGVDALGEDPRTQWWVHEIDPVGRRVVVLAATASAIGLAGTWRRTA